MGLPKPRGGIPTSGGKGNWKKGAAGLLGLPGLAGIGGFMLGNSDIGCKIALVILDAFGSKHARMALNTMKNENNLNGTIKIQLDQNGRFMSAKSNMNQPELKVNMYNELYMPNTD